MKRSALVSAFDKIRITTSRELHEKGATCWRTRIDSKRRK
jgi:hypothetical protein